MTLSVVGQVTSVRKTQVATFKTQVALPIAAWQHVLRLPETYTDIVTIDTKGVHVLKDNTLDTFGFSGKKKENITLSGQTSISPRPTSLKSIYASKDRNANFT